MTDDQVLHVLKEAIRIYGNNPLPKEGFKYIEKKLAPQPDVDLERVLQIWNTNIASDHDQLNDFKIRGMMSLFGMDPNQ